MLRILLDNEVLIINEKKYLEVINEYLSYLIKATKLIRRELLLIIILISNYYDNIRRKLIDLKAIIFFFIFILNTNIK